MNNQILPSEVARYFLAQANDHGELISPLKMQKLVYYAYVWNLVASNGKLFSESIEAWPNGPVVPSLYTDLKNYGSAPIAEDFLGDQSRVDELVQKIESAGKLDLLKKVYEKYCTLTAFELVMLTHSEKPWLEARKGLSPSEKSNQAITDTDILSFYDKNDLGL